MPPSRYKVVEEGRRLVVVDRLTGERVRQHVHEMPSKLELPLSRAIEGAPAEVRAPAPAPRPQLAGSGTLFTTQPWYDDKGPRTVVLSDEAFTPLLVVGGVLVAMGLTAFFFFSFFPFLVVGFFLMQKGTRAGLRRGVTGWLDGLDQV